MLLREHDLSGGYGKRGSQRYPPEAFKDDAQVTSVFKCAQHSDYMFLVVLVRVHELLQDLHLLFPSNIPDSRVNRRMSQCSNDPRKSRHI